MKGKIIAAAIGALAAQGAFAQSSVTLYGLLDAGVSYVSNQGGHSVVKFDDAIAVPSFIGFRGAEDLGGGTQAIFDLESQFSFGTGAMVPVPGSIFGRNAYVGLRDARFGTLTLGNQFDFMNDSLTMGGNVPGVVSGGLYNYPAGPFRGLNIPGNATSWSDWDRTGQEQVSNSVKYVTPELAGFKAGAMYAFGGVPGDVHTGSAVSFGLNYDARNFGAGAAYTEMRYAASTLATGLAVPDTTIRNWGVGAHYQFGALRAVADFTTVHNMQNGASAFQGSVGGLYSFTPAVSLGAQYTYMKGNDVVNDNHANQFSATLDYAFSKRTIVYLSGVYQVANRGANALLNGIYNTDPTTDESSGRTQAIARVGIRTTF